jgi:hypothetical protein
MAVVKMKLKKMTTRVNNKRHSCTLFVTRLSTFVTDDYFVNMEIVICLECKESMLVEATRDRVGTNQLDTYVDNLLNSLWQQV